MVWIDAQASGCQGRVEHVRTARRRSFRSAEELLAFFEEAGRSETEPDSARQEPFSITSKRVT